MPNLFAGYCYATIQLAADAEISQPVFASSSGLVAPISFNPISVTDGIMTFRYKPMSFAAQTTYQITKTYPTCASVGYLTNYSGLSLPDVIVTSWLVVACWVAAWSIKTMRRSI